MRNSALITGGAKRIGRELCIFLAKNGYDIALHYNTSYDDAKKTSIQIERLGVKCNLFKCDLSDSSNVKQLIDKVYQGFPNCSLLVNNASVFRKSDLYDIDLRDFDIEFSINFKSPLFLTKYFSEKKSSKNIINLIDTRIARINSSYLVYNLSKYCLMRFTEMAAKSLAPGIRVNAILPGDILPLEGTDYGYLQKRSKRLPLKKVGGVNNIISALEYLLGNDFVTGECLVVDGGEHLL